MKKCFNEELREKMKTKGSQVAKKWNDELKKLQKQKDEKDSK